MSPDILTCSVKMKETRIRFSQKEVMNRNAKSPAVPGIFSVQYRGSDEVLFVLMKN
jgi:hypothetical protein